MDVLYRYEERRYSRGCNEWDDPLPGYILMVELQEYKVIRETPKGAWIAIGWPVQTYDAETQTWSDFQPKKFVLLSACKRFACPTKEEAAESFKARKQRQISLLSHQLEAAKQALKLVDTPNRHFVQW